MRRGRIGALSLLALTFALPTIAFEELPRVVLLEPDEVTEGQWTSVRPRGVSPDGSFVVGSISTSEIGRAFRWSDQTGFELLEPGPGYAASSAWAVSAEGRVVVGGSWQQDLGSRATLWVEGEPPRLLPVPPGYSYTIADAVSDDGSTVLAQRDYLVWQLDGSEEGPTMLPEAVPSRGWLPYLLAAGGAVVFLATNEEGEDRVLHWVDGEVVDRGPVGGSGETVFYDVNHDGTIAVGRMKQPFSPYENVPVRWEEGVLSALDGRPLLEPRERSYTATLVSSDATLTFGKGEYDAWYVWQPVAGRHRLRDLLRAQYGVAFPNFHYLTLHHVSASATLITATGYPKGVGPGRLTGVAVLLPVSACRDGADNDGDGAVDHAEDDGCRGPLDRYEAPECDDGIDNDFDLFTDLADPACPSPEAPLERTLCNDGRDDDGDGRTDFDGGIAASEWSREYIEPELWDYFVRNAAPDPDCAAAWWNSESGCGLGAELAPLLVVLCMRRRSRPDR